MHAKKIRQITDASVIVAIYGIIFLISRFTGGQLEYNLSFLMPLPLAIYAYKYDYKTAIIPFFASLILSFFLSINPLNVLVFNLPFLLIGILLGGVLIKKDIKPIYSILIITLILSITEILGTLALSKFLGMENIVEDIAYIIEQTKKLLNINTGDFVIIQALMEGLIPSIIIIISLMGAFITYMFFVVIIARILKANISIKFINFFSIENLLPLPITVIYILVDILSIGGIIYFPLLEGVIRILCVIFINVSFIVGAIYFYFGIMVASLFIKYKSKKILMLVYIITILILPLFYVILGIVDNFIGLKKKIVSKMTQANQN